MAHMLEASSYLLKHKRGRLVLCLDLSINRPRHMVDWSTGSRSLTPSQGLVCCQFLDDEYHARGSFAQLRSKSRHLGKMHSWKSGT